jgi:hypothetical protein
MGGQADSTEDMFSKLESMRAVITEVNTQFKDPVSVLGGGACAPSSFFVLFRSSSRRFPHAGKDDVRLRVHIRILVTVRDGASCTGTYRLRNRHAQHRCESASVSQGR